MTRASADEVLAEEARAALTQLGDGDTQVLDAKLSRVADTTGDQAWLITLVLPRPRGSSWDVDRTIALRQEARLVVDQLAAERSADLDGITSVVFSTEQAPVEEIAADEEPEADERTAAFWTPEDR